MILSVAAVVPIKTIRGIGRNFAGPSAVLPDFSHRKAQSAKERRPEGALSESLGSLVSLLPPRQIPVRGPFRHRELASPGKPGMETITVHSNSATGLSCRFEFAQQHDSDDLVTILRFAIDNYRHR